MQTLEQKTNDAYWMAYALTLAEQAAEQGEVPVGAVLVKDGINIGEGYNMPISEHDSTAHAEIRAIRQACLAEKNYRIPDTTLYVTLEPCTMCAGAIVHSRITRVVFAAKEPRAGAAGSILDILKHPKLNHQCEVVSGLMQQESAQLLKGFFKKRR